ncbi:MAG: ATP-binding protein [Hyphomonadaceae bacterium]
MIAWFELAVPIPGSLRVACDAVRVRQCIANLISNAIKFTPSGEIVVTASAARHESTGQHLITIVVSDTGIGIDDETQARLFGNFEQASAITGEQYGGTGLGLAISRNIARLMGGDVTVSSKLGAGATFTLTFLAPEAPEEALIESEAEDRLFGDRPRRILLVDDNAANRRIARSMLAAIACEIDEAEDGERALSLLASKPFDLVLLDLRMPGMDGEETFLKIRAVTESWRDIPVIALTAHKSGGSRERCIALGMNGYVSKPIDAHDLLAQVRSALGGVGDGLLEPTSA